jgi:hypothetical protein
MDWTTWAAIAAVIGALGGAAGWLVRFSTRLSNIEAKADAAALAAASAALQAAHTDRELTEHRVSVAREYASNETIARLEGKLIEAIDRLGNRLDSLFVPRAANDAG